ncbi:hypothetical protein [Salipiger abyssi]|uniref:hypothetical protein n=1 Tax=Salipiger abyssi TaxID=1250539 RepID=UPI001A905335|nr:hypothetical protein [Salipiger abyssi]MBN9890095.1 hypothetical protein [Salipiger abyssi]
MKLDAGKTRAVAIAELRPARVEPGLYYSPVGGIIVVREISSSDQKLGTSEGFSDKE